MADKPRVLLICEDQPLSKYLAEELIVNAGCTATFASAPEQAIEIFRNSGFDIVIANVVMRGMEFSQLIRELKKTDPDCVAIALSEKADYGEENKLIEQGAYEVIAKPINPDKLFFLVRKGAELHSFAFSHRKSSYGLQEQNTNLQKQNTLLAKRIEESTKNLTRLYEDLRTTYMRTIKVLAQAIDARDHYTHSHSQNVAKYAVAISEEMGLSTKDIEMIREACELHDLGKIGVSDSILLKPSSLTPEEWENIKRHPQIAAQILEPLTFLSDVIEMVRQHHEHYDGSGYPEGRRGEDIILGARIINLADAYEAMRSARSYRKIPLSKEAAV
ncbi:MAG: HD domain-containing protein [Candidatus Omnitrophica bacterium]|nr:HD domain-containing protein [Candidatus Omnitrophota bacterium]